MPTESNVNINVAVSVNRDSPFRHKLNKRITLLSSFDEYRATETYSEFLFPLHQFSKLPAGVRDLWWSRFRMHRHDGSSYLGNTTVAGLVLKRLKKNGRFRRQMAPQDARCFYVAIETCHSNLPVVFTWLQIYQLQLKRP